MTRERPSSPPDELGESWFDRPGRRLRLTPPPPEPDPGSDPDSGDELDDPWFVWTPDV